MNRIILVVVAVAVALAGCSGGLKSKIVGTWKIDMTTFKMPDMPDSVKNDPKFKAMMDDQLKKMSDGRIEFKADGTVISTNMNDNHPGKWSLKDNEILLADDKGVPAKGVKVTVNADATRIHLASDSSAGGAGAIDFIKA